MPSATVDLLQPDSLTRPIASPGITLQEKSTDGRDFAGANEEGIERFVIRGLVLSSLASLNLSVTARAVIRQQVQSKDEDCEGQG